ncbi:hypothetical protein [Cyclobacterium roseum]
MVWEIIVNNLNELIDWLETIITQ